MKNQKKKDKPQSKVKVAIVVDPLIKYEKWYEDLKYILELFPNSDIFTAYYNPELTKGIFKNRKINDTFLQLIATNNNTRDIWLRLEKLAYRSLHLKNYDVVISLSSRCAKYVKVTNGIKHISVIMNPQRLFSKDRLDKKYTGFK